MVVYLFRFMTYLFIYIGCKYRPAGEWSVCSIGVSTRTRVMHLRPGQPDSCPTEISKARPCRLTVLHGNSARKAGRLRRIMNKKGEL